MDVIYNVDMDYGLRLRDKMKNEKAWIFKLS